MSVVPARSEPRHTAPGLRPRAAFRALRFGPALEAEYRAASLQSLAYPAQVAALGGAAIWLLFIMVDLVRLEAVPQFPDWPPVLWHLATVRVLVLLALLGSALALRSGRGQAHLRALVAGVFLVLTWGSATAVATYLQLGKPHESYVLALVVMAIFLPLGLGLVEQVVLALACIGVVAFVGATIPDEAVAALVRLPVVLLATGVVSAVGAYLRECAHRGQFLLLRELEWQAAHDPLTGLANRRVFTRHMDAVVRQAQRDQRRVVLCMLDVDHFKLYNDTYGHQAGDEALQRLARVLERLAARPLDLAFRAGGEEMGLILYDATPHDAQALAARLLAEVDRLAIAHTASATTDRLSISAGCALLAPGENTAALDRRADRLLYQAKALGRNCVVMDPALGGQVLRGQAPPQVLQPAG